MDFKKISVITLLMSFFTISAQAEQPMANEYRQMLQSGTYYLEYSVRDYDSNKRLPFALQKKKKPGIDDDKEITSRPWKSASKGKNVLMGIGQVAGQPIGTGITYAVVNAGKDRIQYFKEIIKKRGFSLPIPFVNAEVGGSQKAYLTPRIMYQQGKYYRFSAGMGMAGSSLVISGKKIKDDQVIMLPESEINSPDVDPMEGWGSIRSELSLPLEFAIFNVKDGFQDNNNMVQAPVLQESIQRNIGKNTYESDKYMSKEKDIDNGSVENFIYYALYKEGKIFLIQKYRMKEDGSEEISEEVYVRNIAGQLPEDAFAFSKPIPVYAAGMGDINDFLGIPVQVGTLGGSMDAKK